MNGKRRRTLALLGKVQWGKAEATIFIRYTCDSHGQGVHEGQPVQVQVGKPSLSVANDIKHKGAVLNKRLGRQHPSTTRS
jgi:hypothetical protein